MSRHKSREIILCLAFEREYRGESGCESILGQPVGDGDIRRIYEMLSEREGPPAAGGDMEADDYEYIKRTYLGVFANLEQIDDLIASASINWKNSRISKVSMALLRIAVYEMLHSEDVEVSIAINEAVELSKKYDREDAYAFVNGVLGAIAKTLPAETPE